MNDLATPPSEPARVSGSAHGKVILLGEHAVVYGHPALALGVGVAARASAVPAAASSVRVRLGAVPDAQAPAIAPALVATQQRAFEALLRVLGGTAVAAEAELLLPAGVGLGGSAALGAALAHACAGLGQAQHTGDLVLGSPAFERLWSAAQAWERAFHGNPSGVDAAAALHGGCLRFDRQAGPRSLRLGAALSLVVARVESAPATKAMVAGLAARRQGAPQATDRALEAIGALVGAAESALERGDLSLVGELMNRNHAELSTLGLSTAPLDRACALARRAGAYGAKLTGGGGGGCAVALVPPLRLPEVEAEWRAAGHWCLSTVVPASPPQQ